jgi:hypothetical protein
MPKITEPLKDLQVKNAKPQDKPYKLADGGGLYLLVKPAGGKGWRLKYRFQGAEKLLSLGTYPEVGLQEARKKRDANKKLLAEGIDPSDNRKTMKITDAERAANNFEAVAREWLSKNKDGWAKSHYEKIVGRLENDVFPYLGSKPITAITAPDLLNVVRKIESRGVLEPPTEHLRIVDKYSATPLQQDEPSVILPVIFEVHSPPSKVGGPILLLSLIQRKSESYYER